MRNSFYLGIFFSMGVVGVLEFRRYRQKKDIERKIYKENI
jgi:hypothetical protein